MCTCVYTNAAPSRCRLVQPYFICVRTRKLTHECTHPHTVVHIQLHPSEAKWRGEGVEREICIIRCVRTPLPEGGPKKERTTLRVDINQAPRIYVHTEGARGMCLCVCVPNRPSGLPPCHLPPIFALSVRA